MNQFKINQVVYYITSMDSKIIIQELTINRICLDNRGVYYHGILMQNPEKIPDTRRESELFEDRETVIRDLLIQIQKLNSEGN